MGAVWMRARAEVRARWGATIGLTVIIGLAGGAVIGIAQAARRTDSAYPRFLEQHDAADVLIFNNEFDGARPVSRAQLLAMPEVARVEGIKFQPVAVGEEFVASFSREHDPFAPDALDRFKVIAGRAADPSRLDEVVITQYATELLETDQYASLPLHLGDAVELRGFDPPPPEFGEYMGALNADPVRARVVGVVALPGGFPPQVSEVSAFMYLTPAFYERYPNGFEGVDASFLVKMRDPERDVARFRRGIAALTEGNPPFLVTRAEQDANVQSGIHLQAVAIWLLAAIAAITVMLVLAQTLVRQVFLDAADHERLRALGMSRRQLWAGSMVRMLVPLLAGAALASAIAAATSPFSPIGIAALAEPSPGFVFDPATAVLGAAAIVLLGALGVVLPAWSAARSRDAREPSSRPSRVASLLSRSGSGVVLPAGAGLALEQGRGRRAIPVRVTIAGVAISIGALVASLTFDASINRLLDDPRQHGVAWDLVVGGQEGGDFPGDGSKLLDQPGVRTLGIGTLGNPFTFDGIATETSTFHVVGGATSPVVIEGRAPTDVGADDPVEVLLGTRTMRQLGLRVGDAVEIGIQEEFGAPGQETVPGRIVGRGIPISSSETTRLGEGAVLTPAGALRLIPERFAAFGKPDTAYIDLEPGTDKDAFLDRLARTYTPGREFDEFLYEPPVAKPNDLVSFSSVRDLPVVLTAIVASLCLAILVHTLVTSVRRRRRDLAVFKTLGFARAQIRGSVAIQATILVLIALLIGLPLGAVAGRWTWASFAGALGIVPEPVTPAARILVIVPIAIALANLIATIPARAAARTKPALVLRSE